MTTDAQQSAEESTQVNDIVSTEEVQGSPLNEDDADSTSTEKVIFVTHLVIYIWNN